MTIVKQKLEAETYTAVPYCSRLQAQGTQPAAASSEQQALQSLIIGGSGPLKLLQKLNKQPLHGYFADRYQLQARQL